MTTMRSRLPDERALTWLGLNLEKLGPGLENPGPATLARAVEPAAQPAPVIAVTPSAAAPSNEAALRGVNDILLPPFRPSIGSLDVTGVAPVSPLDQERIRNRTRRMCKPRCTRCRSHWQMEPSGRSYATRTLHTARTSGSGSRTCEYVV